MSPVLLESAAYDPGSRRAVANTIIKDRTKIPGDYFSSTAGRATLPLPDRGALTPSYDEDFPTPRANQLNHQEIPKRNRREEFDELYDVSDDESENVPLFASRSVKRGSAKGKRVDSLVIPSPSAWPTLEKLQKDGKLPDFPLTPPLVSPPPRSLSKLATRNLQAPVGCATPSLDGSITSEDLSGLSCPSTPDVDGRRQVVEDWGVRLGANAMKTLNGISVDPAEQDGSAARQEAKEMQEAVGPLRCDIGLAVSSTGNDGDDPISAISVPSPGGFFSSLNDSARHTWSQPTCEPGPSTSTAESFYDVPWRNSDAAPTTEILERFLEVSNEAGIASPSTARRTGASVTPTTAKPVSKQSPQFSEENFYTVDYDESYIKSLQESAAASLDRTSLWLTRQESYVSSLIDSTVPPSTPTASQSTVKSPSTHKSPCGASVRSRDTTGDISVKSPGKSVRWADESPISTNKALPPSPRNKTFIDGFKHVRESASKGDAFIQRQARIEALHLDRKSLAKAHRDQLQGKYELNSPLRPKHSRPISEFYATEDCSEQKEMIDRVQRERQALEQIKPISWNLEATKMLNGGTLLTSPAGKTLFSANEARVLDLGGQASCDWAWEVALQHRRAQVTTVYTADQAPKEKVKLEGPKNHRHTVVPNLWTLPFRSNHFDIISARSLYALLKTTKPQGSVDDEYDLCLKECLRCLKPGGYLEFAVLDADLLRPGSRAQALSVEFGFNLRTRGYDAAATKSFLPRLKRAGFGKIQRAWLALPMAPRGASRGSENGAFDMTKEAGYLSGMVGAWAWERWMLKLQVEMGKSEERLLDGVAAAIEEGGEVGSAWRYLSGWARK